MQQTTPDVIEALSAKCALLPASLTQAKRECDDLRIKAEHIEQRTADPAPSFDFPNEETRLYSVAKTATSFDLRFWLDVRLSQLEAQLKMTTGEAGEVLRNYPAEVQDSYLWSCELLATECRQLLRQLPARRTA